MDSIILQVEGVNTDVDAAFGVQGDRYCIGIWNKSQGSKDVRSFKTKSEACSMFHWIMDLIICDGNYDECARSLKDESK